MKSALIVFGIFLCLDSFSQERVIEYAFSKEVTEHIKSYLVEETSKFPEDIFYCVLSNAESDTYALDIQHHASNKDGYFASTVESSNRCIWIEGSKIPLVFEFDLLFASYGTDENGRHLRSYSIYEKPYRIEFTKKGKVLKKGISQ